MRRVLLPSDDQARVERLRSLVPDLGCGAIDPALQGLVAAAAAICHTPIALMTLIDEDTQYLQASVGLDVESTPRAHSFCTWTILEDGPLLVSDARNDERFADNPFVLGEPNIVFYAGEPLITSDRRHRLGSVCVIDVEPRRLDDFQLEALRGLSAAAIGVLEQRYERSTSARWAETVLDSIGDCVVATDRMGCVNFLNLAAASLLGEDRGIGLPVEDVLEFDFSATDIDGHPMRVALDRNRIERLPADTRLRTPSGWIDVEDTITPTIDARGDVVGAVMILRDVTSERRLQRSLEWRSSHDALTGLFNRHEFEVRLQARLDRGLDTNVVGVPVAADAGHRRDPPDPPDADMVLFFDLDRFKGVNDELGHHVGDQLLAQVAAAITAEAGDNDTVARLGGDEFAVLLEQCGPEVGIRVARSVQDALVTLRSAFSDHRAGISTSVGVVALGEPRLTVEEVLRRAEVACLSAKREGGGRCRLHAADDLEVEAWQGSVRWMSTLQAALADDHLRLHGQLIVPSRPDHAPSVEVLVRLDHEGELVLPGAFLPAAERFRLMPRLDRWVVDRTLRWLAANPAAQRYFRRVHVNLSGQSIGSLDLADALCGLLHDYDVDGDLICFEITESTAVAELGRSHTFLERLTAQGCHFALDDFGRGFSSFDYLRRFPVDVVKIDGSFVRGLCDDEVSQAMLQSIVSVARLLEKETIAEWVDGDDTIGIVRELGIDAMQGFHLAEPVPLSELVITGDQPSG